MEVLQIGGVHNTLKGLYPIRTFWNIQHMHPGVTRPWVLQGGQQGVLPSRGVSGAGSVSKAG